MTEESRTTKKDKQTEQTTEDQKTPETITPTSYIFALRTSANREDQVIDFVTSNVTRKKLPVYKQQYNPKFKLLFESYQLIHKPLLLLLLN